MPTEIRHVMFTTEEVTTAIRNYCLGSGRILPGSAIFTVDGGEQPYVRVTSQIGRDQRETSAFFAGEALIAPLILFCQKKKIPLPLWGAKEITTIDGQLTLVIKLL
jgi:hypothetical protein